MVYNLIDYIATSTSFSISLSANGFHAGSEETCVSVSIGGGDEQPWFNRQDIRIHFMSRSLNRDTAFKNCVTVYDMVKKQYGLTLPSVTVGGVVYPEVKTWAIRPQLPPQYVGDDQEGRAMFSSTVEITLI